MINLDENTPIFPRCPTFGFAVEPQYLVKITAREGGFERRDRKWVRPLSNFVTVPMKQEQPDIEAVTAFWHVVGGRAQGFRFKDWSDYSSGPGFTVSATDQPFTFIAGSPGGYQLTKRYTVAGFPHLFQDRFIYRPVGSTVVVANDSGQVQDPSLWTVDEATGFVLPGPSFVGVPSTWGGLFYCYVRFDSELQLQLIDHLIQQVSFSLREIRPEGQPT